MADGSTKEMPTEHRDLLRHNILYFTKNLDPTDDFYCHLENSKVITERMYNNIKSMCKENRESEIRELVTRVTKRGDTALYWFLHALRETHQTYIADHLQQQLPGPFLMAAGSQNHGYGYPSQVKRPIRVSDDNHPTPPPQEKYPIRVQDSQENETDLKALRRHGNHLLDLDTLVDDQDTVLHKLAASPPDNPVEMTDPTRDLHAPPSLPMSMDEAEPYDISSSPRGLLLIIDIRKFLVSDLDRHGTSQDVGRVRRTFEEVGFEVIVKYDLSYKDFGKVVGQFVNDKRHAGLSSVALVVMSHGHDDCVVTADLKEIQCHKIIKQFSTKKHFRGKPKFFLFHICRSERAAEQEEHAKPPTTSLLTSRHETDGPENSIVAAESKRQENFHVAAAGSDMVILYPTLHGMKAHRTARSPNPDQAGSWLINILCDVFNKYAHLCTPRGGKHLYDLLLHVQKKISIYDPLRELSQAEKNDNELSDASSQKPQIVELILTTNKRWYLNPPTRDT